MIKYFNSCLCLMFSLICFFVLSSCAVPEGDTSYTENEVKKFIDDSEGQEEVGIETQIDNWEKQLLQESDRLDAEAEMYLQP